MQDLASQLASKFIKIRESKGEKIDIGDSAMIVSDIMDMVEKYNKDNNRNLYIEIQDINSKIKQVKEELADNLPNGAVPEATKELDAVVKSTEDATNRILDSADRIRESAMNLASPEAIKPIEDEIVRIFEACNFQDLTGQRIKKVIATLQYIETSIEKILVSFESGVTNEKMFNNQKVVQLKTQQLMNGPQFEDVAPSQSDIDRLFDSV